jgi:alginate O-acetyltransferase complex protein AlgI
MLFSSGVFIFLFIPVSLIGYQFLSRFGKTALLSWFALISVVFYACWSPVYLLLLGCSILMNFLLAWRMTNAGEEHVRDRWLVAAITANLLLLMWFKYLFPTLNFLHEHHLLHRGFQNVVLPLGISFFTFTQIAYLIDVRQGIAKLQGPLSYTVFVTFFPHLIAGPIIHPREIMPQLEGDRLGRLQASDVALGLSWFILGLSKKVLLADYFATRANALFANPAGFGAAATWLGTTAYAMQLYFDFSGYSDMAMGLARMFSIEFPLNFDCPYKAASIIEFWQRWHMTLSRYLNEYLYTPLVRGINSRRMQKGKKVSRKAQATPEGFLQMVVYPTMTTMFLAGIWHGAGFQFVVFGLLHGSYLTVNSGWRLLTPKGHPLHGKLPIPAAILLTFLCVLMGHIFFRSASVAQATYVLGTMIGLHHGAAASFRSLAGDAATLAGAFLIVWGMPNTQEILGQPAKDTPRLPSVLPKLAWRPTAVWSLTLTALFCASILLLDRSTTFLYFQF